MDVLFVNGTVGVGKTTVARAISAMEAGPHALVDLDELRRCWPSPVTDPFNLELELANLSAVARNYRSAGAERLILAGVIERGEDVIRYVDAVGASPLRICRLIADAGVIEARLRSRHRNDPDGLSWHLDRAGELARILDEADLDQVTADVSAKSIEESAAEVRRAVGWDG